MVRIQISANCLRTLTEDTLAYSLEIKAREIFNIVLTNKLGPTANPTDFTKEELNVNTPKTYSMMMIVAVAPNQPLTEKK